MAPEFLADQVDRSRANLGVDTIDVYYLHNPETQLGFVARDEFDRRIGRAFAKTGGTGGPARRSAGTAAPRGKGSARRTPSACRDWWRSRRRRAAPEHHFRFIQLPFNLGMVEAFLEGPKSVLAEAGRLGIAVIASATLMQARVLNQMPDAVQDILPGLTTDAQRAIQFTRSTPGIAVALVGMGQRDARPRKPGDRAGAAGRAERVPAALPVMTAIEVAEDLSLLDAALAAIPNQPAVFLLWPAEGEPYLSKTGLLRRRLLRLLKEREKPSRLLNLRHTVKRIEYQLTGSPFESSVVLYEQARRIFPNGTWTC